MGKFSDYVGSINEQTNILRENLTNATGVDCSKKSIGACADVVADYVPDLEKEEVYYDRPSWYPDIKAILNSAPDIEKDGVTYVPAWIVLLNNLYTETPFYYTHSTSASAVNYYRSTGGDAVLCSDKCNNDINNANADSLEIGKTIIHTWDTSKDISDPSRKDSNKVRWAIIYQSKSTNSSSVSTYLFGWKDCIECITGRMTMSQYVFGGSTNEPYLCPVRYIELQETTTTTQIGGSSFIGLRKLNVVIINSNCDEMQAGFNYCYSLKYVKMPMATITTQLTAGFQSLKRIDFPDGSRWTSTTQFMAYAHSLENIFIPINFSDRLAGFQNANSLKSIVFADGNGIDSNSSTYSLCDKAYRLENVVLPPNATYLNLTAAFTSCYSLKYVKIPSSVETLITVLNTFAYTSYIELFNDFNISAVNFTGQIQKDLQWLRDLCIWLKDRTGDTANTMIIGSTNLANAQNLWLTFNPDNKRDITWVDAGTEGAINIVEFITTQLNWTLS